MISPRGALLPIAIVVLAVPAPGEVARADRHGFAFTLEYPTQPAHGVELEIETTQSYELRDTEGADDPSRWQHRALVEYGITDHADVALSQVFEQADLGGVHFAGTRLRGRYRFAERGDWPVDLTAVVDAGKVFSAPAYELEPRIVVARSFESGLHLAANLIPRIEIADPGEGGYQTTFVPGWTLGVRVDLSAAFSGGFETWGWLREVGGEREVELWVGPAVSWRPSTKLWFTVGGGAAVVGASRLPDAELRFTIALSI